jgi:phosphonoacetate hydrolase
MEHLARLDELFGEAAAAATDAAFLLTADHGMNHKTRCWDLEKACARRGHPIRIAISVDRDRYLKHHRGYGGVAWVYCDNAGTIDAVAKILTSLEGVETVLTRSEAVKRYHLMPSRIGDLIVLGDRDTVFGELDSEYESLPADYRAHGSLHEMDVPRRKRTTRKAFTTIGKWRNGYTRHDQGLLKNERNFVSSRNSGCASTRRGCPLCKKQFPQSRLLR